MSSVAVGGDPSTPTLNRIDGVFLGGLALLKLLIHLPILGRYGYDHDELYFLACGEHLAFGYVDHAPLVPWIARLADTLFGQSLYGLRISATLAGAAAVFLTGLLARQLGGGRFAQLTACLAMIIAPTYLRAANHLCIPAFELLFWARANQRQQLTTDNKRRISRLQAASLLWSVVDSGLLLAPTAP